MSPDKRQYAVIVGSGFAALVDESAGILTANEFGEPSSPIREMHYDGHIVYLLSRHGDDISIPPHAINYRANIKALEALGVTDIVALNTVGGISLDLRAGQLAIPDQLIDYTYGRDHSIYSADSDTLDFIDFTEPLSRDIRECLQTAALDADVAVKVGGVYAVTQGPRLETPAEVDRLEHDGAHYVGMTLMPEASLAMEMGMRYACLSLIVNFAAGRGDKAIHEDIEENTVAARMQSMKILKQFFKAVG